MLAAIGAMIEFIKGLLTLAGIIRRHVVRIVMMELPFIILVASALFGNWAIGHLLNYR